MGQIRFDLNPAKMVNTDLDIRYHLSDALAAIPGSTISDNGYDYTDNQPPMLSVYVLSENIADDLELAIEYLKQNQLLENNILDAVAIFTSSEPDHWVQAFPPM